MSAYNFETLRVHLGHEIEVALYGDQNVAIECLTCNEVLIDFEKFEGDEAEYLNLLYFKEKLKQFRARNKS